MPEDALAVDWSEVTAREEGDVCVSCVSVCQREGAFIGF